VSYAVIIDLAGFMVRSCLLCAKIGGQRQMN